MAIVFTLFTLDLKSFIDFPSRKTDVDEWVIYYIYVCLREHIEIFLKEIFTFNHR